MLEPQILRFQTELHFSVVSNINLYGLDLHSVLIFNHNAVVLKPDCIYIFDLT